MGNNKREEGDKKQKILAPQQLYNLVTGIRCSMRYDRETTDACKIYTRENRDLGGLDPRNAVG